MIRILIYSLLSSIVFTACKSTEKIIDVPWYISESNADFSTYSVTDTLQKYDKINLKEVKNKANFLAFLSDLNYLNDRPEKGDELIKAAFEVDSLGLCKEYVVPLSRYLFKNTPYRKTSIPGVFTSNFDQYTSIYTKCIDHVELKHPKSSEQTFLKEYLWIKYIIILDQWYRIVNKREFDSDGQLKYDKYCRDKLDEIFRDREYPGIKDVRDDLNTIIFHSEDCEWSHRWLKIYIKSYKNDKFLSRHLKHFLYRSTCKDKPETVNLIKATLLEL